MSVNLNYGQAVELAELVVETASPDFVYHRPFFTGPEHRGSYCAYYAPTGEPSCIVGQILYRLGLRYAPDSHKNFLGAGNLCSIGDVVCDDKTMYFLCRLQEMQDNGICWGDCLKMAKHAAEMFAKNDPYEVERSRIYSACMTTGYEIKLNPSEIVCAKEPAHV